MGKSHATKVFEESYNESFQKEAAVLAPLCHPHVVQLFGRSVERTLVKEVMSTDLQNFIDTRKGTKGCEIPFHVALERACDTYRLRNYLTEIFSDRAVVFP